MLGVDPGPLGWRPRRGLLYLLSLAVVMGFGAIHARWLGHYPFAGTSRFTWCLTYVAFLCIAAYALGLPEATSGLLSTTASAAAAAAAGALGISVAQLALGSALLPRFVVFASALVLTPTYVVCSVLAGRAGERRRLLDRLVVVGSDSDVAALRDDLDSEPDATAVLVGSLTPGSAAAAGLDGHPLEALARSTGATVIALSREAQGDESIVAQAASLHARGVRIRSLSLFYEEWLGKLPITELERVALMFDIGEIHRMRYSRMKRIADLAMAVPSVVLLVPVAAFVALGNRVANRGPLFYRQTRVGRRGQPFQIVKFRTMTPGTGDEGEWTADDDPRVTPFGRWLRRSHLDELPQAINILRGDLSMVGPRPEQVRYVAELAEKIPFYDLRHLVRPGLTGWAQVKFRYGASAADAAEKLQYEFFYLRHQGLGLDLRILGRTLRSVVARPGR